MDVSIRRADVVAHHEYSFNIQAVSSILLFDPILERGAKAVSARFREEDPSIRTVEHVVFRVGSIEDAWRTIEDNALSSMLGETSASVLYSTNDDGGSRMKLQPFHGTVLETDSLSALRHADCLSILDESGAVLRAREGTHFVLPSGSHALDFVRVGDALQDPVRLGRLADWILELIDENSVLLSDTGSISGLVERVRLAALEKLGWSIPYDTIPHYPVESDDLVEVVDGLAIRHPMRQLTVLLSVNSTGGLMRRLSSLFSHELQFITLCHTGDEQAGNEDVICSVDVNSWETDSDSKCARCHELRPVPIDPSTYRPRPNLSAKKVPVDWSSVSKKSDFWRMVDLADALSLHRDVELSGGRARHFSIYIDFDSLIRSDAYFRYALDRVAEILERGKQPYCIAIPRHTSSKSLALLADAVLAELGWTSTIIVQLHNGQIPMEFLGESAQPRIVVLDDAIVNGATAASIRKAFQNPGEDSGRQPIIEFVALLARPESTLTLQMLRRRYWMADGNHFFCVDEILMPSRRACPWCTERLLWKKWLPKLKGFERLVLDRLSQLESGTPEPLLLGGPVGVGAALGAAVGELSPPTAFAAISAVVQEKKELIADSGGDLQRFHDTRLVLDAYFDPVFIAAVFRTFERRDLRWHEFDVEVSNYLINSLVTEGETRTDDALPDEYFAELALAAVTTRIPLAPFRNVLDQLPESRVVRLLKQLAEIHG